MSVILRVRRQGWTAVLLGALLCSLLLVALLRGREEEELAGAMADLAGLGFTPRRILDVGANEGTWSESMSKIVPGAEFFLLEGNTGLEHFLKEKGRPYRIAIIGNEEKKVTFFKLCDGGRCSGASSIFQENTQWGEVMAKEERQMTTIDTVLREEKQQPFDMIKLDVQGAEIIALKGATEALKSVEVILAETSNVEYNKGAPRTLEVLNYLDEIGFEIYDIVEIHRKHTSTSSHGLMFQLDFLFVRKGSHLLANAKKSWVHGGRRA
jgi:FkbM family methyltransferase